METKNLNVRIPVIENSDSGGRRTAVPGDGEQESERSDAGLYTSQKHFIKLISFVFFSSSRFEDQFIGGVNKAIEDGISKPVIFIMSGKFGGFDKVKI